MKIISMTATFGRLEGETLYFESGLNLIHGPNEGGKSTWCAFWKAMLYGIDTRDRDRSGHLADKNRYQPWSGSPMEGELNLEWKGQNITIRRGPKGNIPFGAFSAVYTGTGEPVPFLTAQNCGEMLTGVGREVFERSALLGGGELALTAAPELEKRIAAIVSSGQEDVSFSQVEAQLKEWQNRRKVNRSVGLIPKLEEERSALAEQLDRMSGLSARISGLEGEYAGLARLHRSWSQELESHKKLARQALDSRLAQAEAELEKAKERLETLRRDAARFGDLPDKERLKRAQGELQYLKVLDEEIQHARNDLAQAEEDYVRAQRAAQDSRFAGMTVEEAAAQVQQTLADFRDCTESARKKQKTAGLFPLLGILIAAAAEAALLYAGMTGLPYLLAGLLPALVGVVLGLKGRSAAGKLKTRAAQLLARFGSPAPEELEGQLETYRSRYQTAEAAAAQLKRIRGDLNDKLARKDNDIRDLMDFVHSFAPEVTALFGCSAALSRALNLDFELSTAQEKVDLCAARCGDLAAQGAKAEAAGEAPRPAHTEEECRTALAQLADRAGQVKADLDQARGALSSLGDPAAAAARKEELEEALDRRTEEHQALTLALEALRKAETQLQTRFSPELNRLAGEYLSRLTGQKYSSLTLNRSLEGEAARAGDVLPHSALYLSRGTVDQLYLAVRLAVCALCLPEKPPIILDDALTAFDDQRLVLALDLLQELALNQQILLFTCQNREGQALARHAVPSQELGG